MLNVVTSARPEYDPDAQTLTIEIPGVAVRGDVLMLIVVHADASSITVPEGWSNLGSDSAGGITAKRVARMVDGTESATLVVALDASGDEVQGVLIVLRGAGSIPLLVETSNGFSFVSTDEPGLPAVSSLQAINAAIEVWSIPDPAPSTPPTVTPPDGSELIDAYRTTLLAARTLVVARRRANATGALDLGTASSDVSVDGAAFALVLRDGPPMRPAELVDLVPGNIGLLGKDNRPPREVP